MDSNSDSSISDLHDFLSRAHEGKCYSESQYRNHLTTLRLLTERVLPHAGIGTEEPISKLKGKAENLLGAFAPSAGMNERTARTYALRIESLIRDHEQHSGDLDEWRQSIAAKGGPRRRRPATRQPEQAAKPEPLQDVVEVPPDFVVYVFQLRQSLTIKLPLPRDLSQADVDRLHRWLTTLPFDAAPGEASPSKTEDDDIPF